MSIVRLSKSVVPDIPGTPTLGAATDIGTGRAFGDGAISVSFYQATTGGIPASYTVATDVGSYSATGTTSPLTVTGLPGNKFYSFNAVASSSSGQNSAPSLYTAPVLATTVPDAPSIGIANSDDGRDYDDGGVNITFSTSSGGKPVLYYTVTSNPSGVSKTGLSPFKFTALEGGTPASFTVTATNANGTSLPTTYGTAVTPVTKPAAPVLDSLTAGTNRITAAFHPQSDGGSAILYYIISYSAQDANIGDTEYKVKTVTATTSPYAILNLKSGYTYYVSVQAVNQFGASPSSNVRSRTV